MSQDGGLEGAEGAPQVAEVGSEPLGPAQLCAAPGGLGLTAWDLGAPLSAGRVALSPGATGAAGRQEEGNLRQGLC